MKRRRFLTTGCCAAALGDAPQERPVVKPLRQKYSFEIEVVAPQKPLCHYHKTGDKSAYPRDLGKICPWLRDSMNGMLSALEWERFSPGTTKALRFTRSATRRA